MTIGSLCLTEILKSWKSCSSNRLASQTALSTSASGVALPYFCSRRGSSEPALTPIRMLTPASFAAFAIAPTWSSNLRMLPGFTRTAAQPASIAWKTYFGWKWMSAMTGIWLFFAMMCSTSASSWLRHRDAHDVATGGGQLGDLLQGRVDVRASASSSSTARSPGASPPTSTLPTLIWRDLRRGARVSGYLRHPEVHSGHVVSLRRSNSLCAAPTRASNVAASSRCGA